MALEYIEEAKRATVSLPIPQNQLHAYKKWHLYTSEQEVRIADKI
jgi:hypothetical protein